jgi:hypothetical protein
MAHHMSKTFVKAVNEVNVKKGMKEGGDLVFNQSIWARVYVIHFVRDHSFVPVVEILCAGKLRTFRIFNSGKRIMRVPQARVLKGELYTGLA